MNTLSFYYPAPEVIKASVYTLESKGYRITKIDLDNGIIKARSRFNLLKGSTNLVLHIDAISSYQTNLSIQSKVDNSWFFKPERIKKQIEDHFAAMLYHQISVGHGIN